MSIQSPPPMPPPVHASPSTMASQEADTPTTVSEHRDTAKTGFIFGQQLPSWLVSCILHSALLVLLALLSIPHESTEVLRIEGTIADDAPTEPLVFVPRSQTQVATVVPVEATANRDELKTFDQEFSIEPRTVASISAESQAAINALTSGASSTQPSGESIRLPGKGGYEGRADGRRQQLADEYGGTPESEAAVGRALEWLAAHQQKNGSWDFDLSHAPCSGQCHNEILNPDGQVTPKTAATGLAMLPFLGAGHTHLNGKYAEVVRRGIYYLRSQMRDSKFGMDLQHGNMYGHGIATLAIAEAYAMTNDDDLRDMLLELREFIAAAQHEKGGWRYKPGQPGDMPVTGWQLLALKSCELGGLPIPTGTVHAARDFLTSLSSENETRYGYLESGAAPTPTAIGLLLEMYLGKHPRDASIIEGCHYLYELGPSKTNVYFNYYAMMTLHHARYYGFRDWSRRLQAHLLKTQSNRGHEAGSWHFKDRFGSVGGRLYTTAMCALVLETYYRHLPLWEAGEFPL